MFCGGASPTVSQAADVEFVVDMSPDPSTTSSQWWDPAQGTFSQLALVYSPVKRGGYHLLPRTEEELPLLLLSRFSRV